MYLQFGKKLPNTDYLDRVGAYAVIERNNRLAIVKFDNSSFCLPGGGLEMGENCEDTLRREVVEEIGYECIIGRKIGVAGQYISTLSGDGYYNKIGHFYLAELVENNIGDRSCEFDLVWLNIDEAKTSLYEDSHKWAVGEVFPG